MSTHCNDTNNILPKIIVTFEDFDYNYFKRTKTLLERQINYQRSCHIKKYHDL